MKPDSDIAAPAESPQPPVRENRASREEFLADLSHELRSPLNAIKSWAYLIETQLPHPSAIVQRSLEGIRSGVAQQVQVIEQFIAAARLAAGAQCRATVPGDDCTYVEELAMRPLRAHVPTVDPDIPGGKPVQPPPPEPPAEPPDPAHPSHPSVNEPPDGPNSPALRLGVPRQRG